ncbi:hypothetical protein LINGRAHAP2_LOCUS32848 [Linum grandiflorum]
MQEILDGIYEAKVDGSGAVVFNWDQTVAGMKEEVCK